jgi:ABC transport system ATP-binding/permease protein
VRERAVGLSTNAYLLAKMSVFTVFAILQATIAVAITFVGKGVPTRGAVILGNAAVELWFDITFTCVAAAMVGLALSALAKSSEQIMPLLVVAIMSQLVFSGGTITDRIGLDQISWLTPARWGYALSGSTVDIRALSLSPDSPQDSHWSHTHSAWLLDVAMLTVVSLGYLAIVRWRIRLKKSK